MRGVSIFSGIKTAISVASLMFVLGLPAKAHADSQADVEGSLTAAQSVTGTAAMPETAISEPSAATSTMPLKPEMNTFYLTKGLPRAPDEKELKKKLKPFVSKEDYARVFAPRDDVIGLMHTSEHCVNKRGKIMCTSEKNLANYIKKYRLANYLIGESCTLYVIVDPINPDGTLNQMSATKGAGQSLWNGIYSLNSNSINIEIQANVQEKISRTKRIPISECQYNVLEALLDYLPLTLELGHNQVALDYSTKKRQRKGDPGADFEWEKIGRPNYFLAVDKDITTKRAKNSPRNSIEFIVRALPGQICAEQITPEELAKAEPKSDLGNIANVSYCPTKTETVMNSLTRFLTFNF